MFEPWSPHDEPGRSFDGWVEPCACVDCEAAIRAQAKRDPVFVVALKTGCDRKVFSETDLCRREARLTGRRRSWFLSQHSVATVAAFVEVYGTAGLHVFEDGRDPQSFSFDLAAVADAGRRAEGE